MRAAAIGEHHSSIHNNHNCDYALAANDAKAVLEASDTLRDTILPDLGVRMEDKGD